MHKTQLLHNFNANAGVSTKSITAVTTDFTSEKNATEQQYGCLPH